MSLGGLETKEPCGWHRTYSEEPNPIPPCMGPSSRYLATTTTRQIHDWDGGKHMCKGQRLAALAMKIVVAYCLMNLMGGGIGLSRCRIGMIFLPCRPQGECTIRFPERMAGEGIHI